MMRTYLQINLKTRTVEKEELHGEAIAKAGRYLIAKTLLEKGLARVDPLSAENPLIFSAGPLAGTSFSNANRTSVGCKSPLTGGIKESNGGGTFSYGLGQLHLAGFTLNDISDDWVVIHLKKDGTISFDEAAPYLKKNNFAAADLLYERYGKKVALAICGPVGEYQGLLAGIAFSDSDGRPSRLSARGGVGAVMGSKRVKAIVVDLDKIPQLHDRKKSMGNIRTYAQKLQADSIVMNFYNALGTMGMADVTNYMGGLPVRNFSGGQFADTSAGEAFKMGAEFIGDLNRSRGGSQTHACMPGCVIQCSNVYFDQNGKEVVSPVEYETLGLLGTNCCIGDPSALAEIEAGTPEGRLWAQGTARVGEHYGVKRVPVIKKQAISAYDPRIIEATGITMMVTAQGADHTAGNAPRLKTRTMTSDEIINASLREQILSAATDSLGLCVFGRSVTNVETEFFASAINDALGTTLDGSFFFELGRETLRLEWEFNRQAGFTAQDDELPGFFYEEALPPTRYVARFHSQDVEELYARLAKARQ
jgi:aldehyde:ferredoxin oxidoreductase